MLLKFSHVNPSVLEKDYTSPYRAWPFPIYTWVMSYTYWSWWDYSSVSTPTISRIIYRKPISRCVIHHRMLTYILPYWVYNTPCCGWHGFIIFQAISFSCIIISLCEVKLNNNLNKPVYSTSPVLTDKMSHIASFLLRSYYSLSVA